MVEVVKKFDAALAIIKSLPEKGPYRPSNETLLAFYGYYKQAMKGNNTTSQPWSFDIIAKAKWDAWKKNENLSKDEAMQGYVDALLKVIEDIPESEKQNLVSLDKRNVLQDFLTLVHGTKEQESLKEADDVVLDECTSIKSDDEYWDAERVDSDTMEDTIVDIKHDSNGTQPRSNNDMQDGVTIQINEDNIPPEEHAVCSAVNGSIVNENCTDNAKSLQTVSIEDDGLDTARNIDVCKSEEDISLSEFQNTFNSALRNLQKDINNVIIAVAKLEEALKVSSERRNTSKQDIQPAKRAVEVSSYFRHFLQWNWKWALFFVLWPFISQLILRKLRTKRS